MSNKRSLLFRIGAIAVLVLIAAFMMVVGRGHTVYFDNKAIEYQGKTYEAPYKVTVTVKDKQAAKLYENERGSATNIGQSFEMTLRVMQDKGGSEQESTYRFKLPYSMDGIVLNIPAMMAGMPPEAYLSEFVVMNEENEEVEEIVTDEFSLEDI